MEEKVLVYLQWLHSFGTAGVTGRPGVAGRCGVVKVKVKPSETKKQVRKN